MNKEKPVIYPVSFIAGERNNLLGLNTIYAGVLVEIQLVLVLVPCLLLTGLQCVCVWEAAQSEQTLPVPENAEGTATAGKSWDM